MVLDLKNVYGSAWNIFKKSWWQYIIATLILMFCMFIPYVGSLLQFFFMLLVLNAALKGARDEEVTFSSFFDFKKVFTLKAFIFVVLLITLEGVIFIGFDSISFFGFSLSLLLFDIFGFILLISMSFIIITL